MNKTKIYFVWHWHKRSTPELQGAFAAADSLTWAISKLSENPNLEIKILAFSKERTGKLHSPDHKVDYVFFKSKEDIAEYLNEENPDYIFFNHNPRSYTKLLKAVDNLQAKKGIYYSAFICHKYFFFNNITKYHKKFDFHIVDHKYQGDQLVNKFGINPKTIVVGPKAPDLDYWKPMDLEKKWDCIYPGRGPEGYLKRFEIAIEACRLAEKTICIPGANLRGKYDWVTSTNKWLSHDELLKLYNQSRCLVITTNYLEMGPRVIMEAAACNLPIVCCDDSPACVSHVKNLGGFIAKPNAKDVAQKIKLAVKTKVDYRNELRRRGWTVDLLYRRFLDILAGKYDK